MASSEHVVTLGPRTGGEIDRLPDVLAALAEGYGRRVIVLDLGPATGPPATLTGEEAAAALRRCPVPIVAALTGALDPEATALALGADVRVADRTTTLAFRGVGTRLLLQLAGAPGSVAILESGLRLGAEAALEVGLVSAVTRDGGALAGAQRLAATIASRGPIATRFAKEAIWRGLELRLDHGLRMETDLTVLLQTTKDRAEGVAAFLEKRQPTFTGE